MRNVSDAVYRVKRLILARKRKNCGINIDTLYNQNKHAKDTRLGPEPSTQPPDTCIRLTEDVQKLTQQNRLLRANALPDLFSLIASFSHFYL